MKKKRTWSSMAKRTACILTALCVTAAAVPGTGGYNYSRSVCGGRSGWPERRSVCLSEFWGCPDHEQCITVCPESGSAGQRSYQKRERRYLREVRHILMEHLHLRWNCQMQSMQLGMMSRWWHGSNAMTICLAAARTKNICSSRQGRDGAFSIWILIWNLGLMWQPAMCWARAR